jgi:hypothetical protein
MKIKSVFAFVLMGFCAFVVSAQNGDVAYNFEKNKTKYKLEKFAEGEDASSGYDYLIYKDKEAIVKIRVIWSSSANPNYWIEDYYYNNSKLNAFYRYDLSKRNYRNAKNGRTIPLKEVERLFLTDLKLNAWTEKGKAVSKEDARWAEKEKEILEKAAGNLEMYKMLKEES